MKKIFKVLGLSFLIAFFLCLNPQKISFASDQVDAFNSQPWKLPDRSGSFWPIPGKSDLFIGRTKEANKPDNWSLIMGKMDWTTNEMKIVRSVLSTPANLPDGKQITQAFDPSVVYYNNEYWVSFECWGYGFTAGPQYSNKYMNAACIGPLNINGGIDLSRTYVVVWGRSYIANDKFYYSASVPKFLLHQGKLYLYWSAFKHDESPVIVSILTTRGVELEQETSVKKRLWAKGANGAIFANSPQTVEVSGVGQDNRSDAVSDISHIFSDGNYVYAIMSRGGSGGSTPTTHNASNYITYCIDGWGTSSGCYRMAIARATTPLGNHIFNQTILPDGVLPSNPQGYAQYWTRPNSTRQIFSYFGKPSTAQHDIFSISEGTRFLSFSNGISALFNQHCPNNVCPVCIAGTVTGCKVCKPNGSGWVDDNSKCAAGQTCSPAGACIPFLTGKVADSSGKGIPNIKINLCQADGSTATTNANGVWSKNLSPGITYCARVVTSTLPTGYTSVQAIGNNSCHTNAPSYELQMVGVNKFESCSAQNFASWDLENDNNLNFTINNPNCAPKTCATLSYACGTVSDGCGKTLNCGSCVTGKTCQQGVCMEQTDAFNTQSQEGEPLALGWQIPGTSNQFISRFKPQNSSAFAIGMGTMDWSSRKFSISKTILNAWNNGSGITLSDGGNMSYAYDPSVATYNNERWVAFECFGTTVAGSCMGPLDANGNIDISRTYNVIKSVRGNDVKDGFKYSASVPKLLAYQGKLYLYWSMVKIKNAAPNDWYNLTVRGIELQQESGAKKRLWPKGVGAAILANDSRTVEVWGLGSDNRSNTVADLQQIFNDGQYIYAIAARGGSGGSTPEKGTAQNRNPIYCIDAEGSSNGCYRLSIARATSPLGYHIFNQTVLPDGVLPSNPQGYGRYWLRPDGTPYIVTTFLNPSIAQKDALSVLTGNRFFLLPNGISSLFTQHCSGNNCPVCIANTVSGCNVCKSDGSAWTADNSKCAANQTCSAAGLCVPNLTGKVINNSGQPIPNVKIEICNNSTATTNTNGIWSKDIKPGTSYCARIDTTSLSQGFTSVQGTSNNSCHPNSHTYEFQSASYNKFVGCSSGNSSWDLANDDNLNFTVNYPTTKTCTPNAVSGCKVCKPDGSAWLDDNTKCATGKKCSFGSCVDINPCTNECTANAKRCSNIKVQTCGNYDTDTCTEWSSAVACATNQTCDNGTCVNNCVPKTCITLGNYQCGSWSNGCGSTINCGTCAAGKTCSNGQCVANCTSHASKKCDSGNLYWYNSCNTKEDLAQNCGITTQTNNYKCNSTWTQRETIQKGCTNNACTSTSIWNNVENCAASGKSCSNGTCITPQTCTPNAIQGCKVCNAQGTAWVDINSKCATGQTCQNGICVNQSTCVNECLKNLKRCTINNKVQTCGNYDSDSCTEWGGDTTCATGKACIAGYCFTMGNNNTLRTELFDYINQLKQQIQDRINQLRASQGG